MQKAGLSERDTLNLNRGTKKMLVIAIQKSGRLNKRSLQLLMDCGISIQNGSNSPLKLTAHNFPLQVLFLRDDDIPECIEDGAADIGIVGENVLLEKEAALTIEKRLGFAKCRMSLAVPINFTYSSVQDLSQKNIATSYPRILKNYLKKNKIAAGVHEISGSVEIAPSIGMADAVFDIVSTGSTLISNGLKEVEKVLFSEAVLLSKGNLNEEKQALLNRLMFRIDAVQRAQSYKYIMLNAPNSQLEAIASILPSIKSPTIIPLAQKGWSSIHSVIEEDTFWQNIESLKAAGAEDLLILPIEKLIR